MKLYKRFCILLVCIFIITISCPAAVFAAENGDVTLKIIYEYNDIKLSGAHFDIYQVATVDDYGETTQTQDFSSFDVDLNKLKGDELIDLTIKFEEHVIINNIVPTDYGKTDEEGILLFPNYTDKLDKGIYLVVGHKLTKDGVEYNTASFLVSLPKLEADGHWVYDVEAAPKADDTEYPPPPPNVPPPPPNVPPPPPNVPQTGQLWWPVPILLMLGILFIVVGIIINKGQKNEE